MITSLYFGRVTQTKRRLYYSYIFYFETVYTHEYSDSGTVITVAVMKLEGGSGGPVRVCASMNSDTYTSTSSVSTLSRLLSVLWIIVCSV